MNQGKNEPRRILITRPLGSAKPLAQQIKKMSLNLHPVIFPAIEIRARYDRVSKVNERILNQLKKNFYEIVIFISPTAVEMFAQFLQKNKLSSRSLNLKQCDCYAVGKETALSVLKHLSLRARYPQKKYDSEHLLTLNTLQKVSGKTILICRGKGGNPQMNESLVKRQAKVSSLILYERIIPQPAFLPNLENIDLIVCTSQQSLINLVKLFKGSIKNKQFLVSSDKLVSLGKQLGLKHRPTLVKHAGNEAILDALREIALKKG